MEHDRHECQDTKCTVKCPFECNRLCSSDDHFHSLEKDAVHYCGQEHNCAHFCEAQGICEVVTALKTEQRTYKVINCQWFTPRVFYPSLSTHTHRNRMAYEKLVAKKYQHSWQITRDLTGIPTMIRKLIIVKKNVLIVVIIVTCLGVTQRATIKLTTGI